MGRLSLRAAALLLLTAVAVADPLTCPTADGTSYTAAGGDAFLVQCGVDFAGGDISAVNTATFNACLDACDATAGCIAVAYNGNNCYMKSAIDGANSNSAVWGASKLATGTQPPRPLACPASDGIQVVEAKGNSYTIQCGIDRNGGDLRNLITTSFEACLLVCDSTPSCVAVSYHDTGYCYLKNTLTVAEADADVWGAVLTSLASTSTGSTSTTHPTCPGADGTVITEGNTRFLVQCGIDHYGGDLTSLFTQTFEACLEACAANSACVALTFAGPEPGYCYLKSSVTDTVGGGGNQWGAIVIPGPPSTSTDACPGADGQTVQEGGKDFVVHCSTDYYGGDLVSEYANTFDQCLIICAVTPGCVGVSYNGPGPTYCYLKSEVTSDVRQDPSVWGAVLAPTAPPTCGAGTLSCNGGACQDVLSDPNNCGACGNVCASGICAHGACSAPTCNGAACGGIQACTGGCFCFEGASTVGFCGQNTPCALDPDCTTDADCALGSVCAVNTCCGKSICLAVCTTEVVKRGLRNNVRMLGGRQIGSNVTYPAGLSS